jgi:flagellar hook-associated protein 2
MASITTTGIGSGLDIAGLVQSLVRAEGQAQASRLERREAGFQARLSAYGSFRSAVEELRSALEPLKTLSRFQGRAVTSGNQDIVTGTAGTTAAPGSFAIEVVRLAAAQKLRSGVFAAETTAVGTGMLVVTTGGKSMTLTIDSTRGTLAGIRDALNGASDNPGVTASIVTGTAGAQLVLTSRSTGAGNAITVTQSGGDGGLASLVYDPANSILNLTEVSAAQDASILVDGVEVTSATNSFGSAISGVTIDATGVSTVGEPTTLTIAYDTTGARSKIDEFVGAYNSLVDNLRALASYDPETKVAGPLLGDATYRDFSESVRRLMSTATSGLGVSFATLAELGISRKLDGTLEVNDTKLTAALTSDFDGVGRFFSAAGEGVATRMDTLLERYVTAGGALDTRIKGLQQSIDGIGDEREALQARLTAYEARLRTQFNALDSLVARLRSTGDYLTQQLGNLPGAAR